MSIAQRIQRLQNNLSKQSGWGIQDSITQLRSISRFTQTQMASNQTFIKQKIPIIVPLILQNFGRLQGSSNQTLLNQFGAAINYFKQAMNPYLSPLNRNQLKQVNNRVNLANQKRKIEEKGRQVTETAMREFIKSKTSNNTDKIQSLSFDYSSGNSLESNSSFTIEKQVQPIRKILNMTNSLVPIERVPQSVNFLNKYAVQQGYMPMGSISDIGGKSYLGRSQYKQGQQQKTTYLPKNNITTGKSPNIVNNFKYYANNAINSWNTFVQDQHKLIQFSNKIATSQLRRKYMQDQIRGLNTVTFQAQALATLCYYYFYIPLQQFLKYKLQRYDGSIESFLNNYLTGTSVSKNPFLLTAQNGKKILQILFTQNLDTDPKKNKVAPLLAKIVILLKSISNRINQFRINDFNSYVPKKQAQARAYFQINGLQESQYAKILATPFIANLEFKTISLPSLLANSQLMSLVQKIQSKRKVVDSDASKWTLTWGVQKIPACDYVWQYNV